MSTWKWFVKFPEDNVVTVTKDAPVNTVFTVGSDEISVLNDISFGHKIAIKKIEEGEDVLIRDEEKKKSLQRS